MFISIHAPREGGDDGRERRVLNAKISIHAPREGGDEMVLCYPVYIQISIHAPREGGDSKDAQFYPRIFDK